MQNIIVVGFLFCSLIFNLQNQNKLSESEKIDILIRAIENLGDAQFYRNGSLHSAQESADHLRMKYKRAGNRVKTAEEFIDHIATKSYLSGKEYKIIFNDDTEIKTGEFLHRILEGLEKSNY
jgi:hypothetical protein